MLPSTVTHGQPISANLINEILATIRSLKLSSGPGIICQTTSGGTTVRLAEDIKKVTGITAIEHPFKVANVSTESAAKHHVTEGSVNDVTIGGSDVTVTIPSAGTYVLYLICALSTAGVITGVTMSLAASQPADTDTAAHISIAQIIAASNGSVVVITEINQLVTHSLRFYACNRVVTDGTVTDRGTYNFWGV